MSLAALLTRSVSPVRNKMTCEALVAISERRDQQLSNELIKLIKNENFGCPS